MITWLFGNGDNANKNVAFKNEWSVCWSQIALVMWIEKAPEVFFYNQEFVEYNIHICMTIKSTGFAASIRQKVFFYNQEFVQYNIHICMTIKSTGFAASLRRISRLGSHYFATIRTCIYLF